MDARMSAWKEDIMRMRVAISVAMAGSDLCSPVSSQARLSTDWVLMAVISMLEDWAMLGEDGVDEVAEATAADEVERKLEARRVERPKALVLALRDLEVALGCRNHRTKERLAERRAARDRKKLAKAVVPPKRRRTVRESGVIGCTTQGEKN
ncbi:hypothetical protein CBR_g38355 [Chara braunii]|uniref:Uncharacterized protein n=1 Tax=Chara braunii TaxID=69332 RepID=A0A388LQA4_CHABU|nr:hypothetical protein CBR_g38355 [Chara braunii]|eukprot:GBG84382.1 hypothetical protein CBR_g38355 [Chara braunii]